MLGYNLNAIKNFLVQMNFGQEMSVSQRVPNIQGVSFLTDSPEYLGNERRYEFRSCGNLFSFERDIVLLKRVFCRWRRVELLKVIIFLNGTIIFQTPTIVARKMTSSMICDKRSFKVI